MKRFKVLLGIVAAANILANGRMAESHQVVQLTNSDTGSEKRPVLGGTMSSTGDKIAFMGFDLASPTRLAIYTVHFDGTALTRLSTIQVDPTTANGESPVVISANATKVAFTTQGFGGDAPRPASINIDGSGLVALPYYPVAVSRIWLSGDGTKIAFSSTYDPLGTNSDNSQEIFLASSDGTWIIQLTNSPDPTSVAQNPMISADGTKVVFSWNHDPFGANPGKNHLPFIVDATGIGLVQLAPATMSCPGFAGCSVSLSSSGHRVTFLSAGSTNNAQQLFSVNSDGSNPRQITFEQDVISAFISGNGDRIAFSSSSNYLGTNSDQNIESYTINFDGSRLSQITNTDGGNNLTYGFSETGARILLFSESDLTGSNSDRNQELFMVSVSDIPTNAESCKNGGWKYLSKSDGSNFRNQGDCESYVRTGRS